MRNKIQINPTYQHLESALENFYGHFEQSTQVLQDARNETKVVSLGDSQETLAVIKSFKVPNALNRLIYSFFRKSKARRSYEHSLILDVLAPTPIAYLEAYHSGLIANSYFICQHYPFDFELHAVITDAEFADRENVYKAFAHFTYDLHERSVFHKDYSWKNILIRHDDAAKYGYEMKVVDLNRMRFGQLSLKERMQNFSRLSLNDTDMRIIITEYAQILNKEPEALVRMATGYRDRFVRNRLLKNKLRGRA